MGVWIDPPAWPAHGRRYAHLVTDTDLAELHAVAAAAGISPRAFDGDHYDVPDRLWEAAVAAGARPTTAPDLVARLNASGLRLRKRKGDKGVARLAAVRTPLGVTAVDVVRSPRPVRPREVFAHAELTASPGAWGVRVSVGGPAPEDSEPVGYLRLAILSGADLIQAHPGLTDAAGLPLPWRLLV
ncbi:MAG TPA: DUF4031 domain-containing protein [Propionibacteriaceae bacterium]|nr:DUF4031 domain-containing protein [Propionibacteriaceae bacterium]